MAFLILIIGIFIALFFYLSIDFFWKEKIAQLDIDEKIFCSRYNSATDERGRQEALEQICLAQNKSRLYQKMIVITRIIVAVISGILIVLVIFK